MSQQASLFDGTSARSYAVTVAAGDGVLKLSRDSGWDDEVRFGLSASSARIRSASGLAGMTRPAGP
ncbi:hypothetical protein H9L15_07095 [Sphingomonas daechungensis]|uniref:Uncharacterized protein n=1 Tax=Sphingomonas daechungensis TaxID=1176646 RepID=A0ABX6T474_9SPHN|nr:hypothetical protein [Sphingomonas daechungensis]QNP44234.1 hypothetical protein H9L15_07095 [Sphingomonas daechungensis]